MKIVYNKPCLESKGWSCTDHVSLLHIKTISSHLFPRQLYNLKGTVSVISRYFIIFFICHDLIVNFKNIYSCFEDFWSWRRHFHIFQECSNIIFKKPNKNIMKLNTPFKGNVSIILSDPPSNMPMLVFLFQCL